MECDGVHQGKNSVIVISVSSAKYTFVINYSIYKQSQNYDFSRRRESMEEVKSAAL